MSSRRSAIAVLALVVLHACAGLPIVPPAARPIACPAPEFFDPERTFEFTVPEGGGAIPLPHGHTITFERGAVPGGSQYRVTRARNQFAALRFDPLGNAPRTFATPANLTLDFTACNVGIRPPGFGIYRWGEDDVLRPRTSSVQGVRVTAPIDGFSVYAIGSI
jgi:hypothetical protein